MHEPTHLAPATLSDRELERLDTLLETHAVPHDGMSLEMLDGFLSALIVGPEQVMPSEFIDVVWNKQPDWASGSEAEEAIRLVLGLWNDIVARLAIELDDDDIDSHAAAMPLLAYPALPEPGVDAAPVLGSAPNGVAILTGDSGSRGDSGDSGQGDDPFAGAPADFPLGAAWALGFLRGVGMRQEAWEHWAAENDFIEDDLGMLETLALFSTEQAEELGLEAADIPQFNDRLDLIADLPSMLQDMNMLRLTPKTVRRPELPGRNDPCPCGSGKKFKRCCGSPEHLH